MNKGFKTDQKLSKMPELLAPAGDFQAFLGAINAGADAVYLAGDMFGARAYAKNLSKKEILDALLYAHLRQKKVYLTVNTLTKNYEGKLLYDFLKPFYFAGLDGVIVQDFGVFSFLHKVFPDLPLHVSTQMSITGALGAKALKEMGASRIVPARELTLKEIEEINALGIETECFIHGSMCYSYSGQCLFSSFLGGRSGNRGRCAGPCRQPYSCENSKKESYLLSLKDLCTLQMLPKLIDAGISSFKIEGRMKAPAYAAGVTEIYRKYIDLYASLESFQDYKVEEKDLQTLKSLYLRTDLQSGYYEKTKGRDMVSMHSPSYNKTDDELLKNLTEKYCRNKIPVSIPVQVSFVTGEKSKAEIITDNPEYAGPIPARIACTGEEVQKALNAPIRESDLKKRFQKSSNGFVSFDIEKLELSEDAFLPVGSVNALRRNLEQAFEEAFEAQYANREIEMNSEEFFSTPKTPGAGTSKAGTSGDIIPNIETPDAESLTANTKPLFRIFISTFEQLEYIAKSVHEEDSICIPVHFFNPSFFEKTDKILAGSPTEQFYAVLPSVLRSANLPSLDAAFSNIQKCRKKCAGYYVSQPDSWMYLKEAGVQKDCIFGDLALYSANSESVTLFADKLNSYTASVELSGAELRTLNLKCAQIMIYGRIPLMQSANCILNTTNACRKEEGFTFIKDRTRANFPVYTHCTEKICYNTIYNSVPLSLHKFMNEIFSLHANALQIRFTNESTAECESVYGLFHSLRCGEKAISDPYPFTNGHYNKGVL